MFNLKIAREAAGLTQDQLAEKAGTTTRTIIRIEGMGVYSPSVATAKRLADALGVTVDDLLREAA